jgi:hypothetical protein
MHWCWAALAKLFAQTEAVPVTMTDLQWLFWTLTFAQREVQSTRPPLAQCTAPTKQP